MNVCSYNCCLSSTTESKCVSALSNLLKIVSERSRLELLCLLRQGEHCVCEMTERVGLSQSLVSHHLRDLKEVGVVIDERRGTKVYYSLTKKGEHVTNLLFSIPQKEVKA